MPHICQPVGNGVFVVDAEHVRPRLHASDLIEDGGRAAFVDTGTDHSVPNLLRGLAALEVDAGDVDATKAVYGAARFAAQYGAIGYPGDVRARHALLDGEVMQNAAGLGAWLARELA